LASVVDRPSGLSELDDAGPNPAGVERERPQDIAKGGLGLRERSHILLD
jgi:hypothetical protein